MLRVGVLVLACLVASGAADELSINTLVDTVLVAINEALELAGDNSVSVPDIDETFKVSILKGGITATGGTFSDLSTLQRSGDAVLDLDSDSATLLISLQLGNMQLNYSDCTIWLEDESATDELSVTVGSNSLSAEVNITVLSDLSCEINLEYIKFTDIGDLDIEMADLDEIPYIASKISNWILENFQDDIESSLQTILTEVISEELQNYDFCSLI